jgi:hypothetical protein
VQVFRHDIIGGDIIPVVPFLHVPDLEQVAPKISASSYAIEYHRAVLGDCLLRNRFEGLHLQLE